MGPLSAVAVAGWLIIYGLTAVSASISATPRGLGWLALVAAALVIIDVLFVRSEVRWAAWRRRRAGQPPA